MKGFKKIALVIITMLIAFVVTSCSATKIKTNLNVASRNNKLTLVATFTDEEEKIFTDYTPYAYIYEMDGNEVGDQLESLSFTLDDELSSGDTFVTDELVFDDLSEETSYTIRITLTIDGKSETLYEAVHKTSDLGTEENPIEIAAGDKEAFLAMADDREAYYVLLGDIDFAGEEIDPLFTSTTRRFEGGLDGKGYTIKNFSISSNNQYNGLFGVNNGVIKNLKIDNEKITTERTSEMNCGLLVGYNTGIIDNVTISNSTIISKSTAYTLTYKQNVGGLVGYCGTSNSSTEITNCSLNNVRVDAAVRHQANVGGLIGEVSLAYSVRNAQKIENNYANVGIRVAQEIRASIADAVDINIGGLVGFCASALTNCVVDTNISASEEENAVASGITVTTTKADSANYENGFTDYNLAVGGVVGNSYNNVARHLSNIAFIGSLDVAASPVYQTYVAGLIGILGNNIEVDHALANISTLKIVGPKASTETKETTGEEETETATYNLYYGLLISAELEANYYQDNTIISYNANSTINVDSDYVTKYDAYNSTDITSFSDFVKGYIN